LEKEKEKKPDGTEPKVKEPKQKKGKAN